ncbi:OmpA family protein, partial [bacterium]|nr:OmpA family protein [bacterium]
MKKFILSLGLVLFFSQAGFAKGVEIGPYIGTFEGHEEVKESYIMGLKAGYSFDKSLGLEGGFGFVPSKNELTDEDVDLTIFNLDLLYHFREDDSNLIPYGLLGLGGINFSGGEKDGDHELLVEGGAGFKYLLNNSTSLRADVRYLMTDPDNHLIMSLGLGFLLGDDEEEEEEEVEIEDVQPLPPDVDTDGDGLLDSEEARYGTDPHDKDTDDDSLSDGEEVQKYQTDPLNPDTDNGGAKDGVEVLRNETNPLLGYDDNPPLRIEAVRLLIEFDTNKTDIKPMYRDELEKFADTLKEHSKSTVIIEGHTDNQGDFEYNMDLSSRRAESVKDYLVKNFGINPQRLKTKGFGPARSIDTNETPEGKANNRRVMA